MGSIRVVLLFIRGILRNRTGMLETAIFGPDRVFRRHTGRNRLCCAIEQHALFQTKPLIALGRDCFAWMDASPRRLTNMELTI